MGFDEMANAARTAVKKGVGILVSGVKCTWRTVRSRISRMVGSFVELFAARETIDPDECERLRRTAARDAVLTVLGDDPVAAIRDAERSEREQMLDAVVDCVSSALEIPSPDMEVRIMDKWTTGYYSFEADKLVVNRADVDRSPMETDEAVALLNMVLHELYHAFQRHAIVSPSRHRVSKEEAGKWRMNFKNYISYEHNPRLYRMQPLETSANAFAYGVLAEG